MTSGAGLRIAQLANFVSPVSGGMRRAIDQLGRGYLDAGAERILVVPGAKDRITEGDDGILVEVRSPQISRHYRMIATPWQVFSTLAKFGPTSLEVSDKWTLSQAGTWARRHDVGSILFSHERLDDMLAGWLRRQWGVSEFTGALNRRLAKQFDRIVYTSDYAGGEFENLEVATSKVPLGVDLDTFTPPEGPPSNLVPKLCYVGRMSREKSPQLGVQAVVDLHRRGVDVELHMYGTGPDAAWLQELAGDAPVFFHGYLSGRDEIAEVYRRSDVSLSVCPYETFGLAVLEALACGTPVVTANRGGASELVTPDCAESDQPFARNIANAIVRLLTRLGAESGTIRANARAQAEKYSWDQSVQRMLDIHRSVTVKEAKPWA